ncbi:hypothetical protein WSM22_02870 [Cytophagales bacterium WSM2-2]|nr:hypothetical protein WSM22_02870 [Cytophagales bacterium WSM2-2]
MTDIALIQHYNKLNGHPINKSTLVEFHKSLEKHIDSVGHGPYMKDIKGIYERIGKAIKTLIAEGAYRVDHLELIPIEVSTQPERKAESKVKLKRVVKVKETPKQKKKIAIVISKFRKKELKTPQGKVVRKRKQAVAIALREAGVPKKKSKSVKPPAPIERPTTKKLSAKFGGITADQTPAQAAGTFILPGVVGELLGNLQRYKLEIVIPGETHSSKSQLGMQIANAFASLDDEVAWIDWEQGGLESADTQKSIARNVDPENKKRIHVIPNVPRTLEAVKSLTEEFKVIALDSGTKLNQVTNAWMDTLREEYPKVVWIILMQQNEKGGTRGGSSAEFDAPVVLKTYRPSHDTHESNYAVVFKNRGNKTGLVYSISGKKILSKKPEVTQSKAA